MPKAINPITDVKARTAKPQEKEYKIFDGGGLYLLVTPSGGKLWRMKYRFEGKEKQLAFGPYPDLSVSDARKRREDARKLLVNGVDPGEVKKAQKATRGELAANTFEVVAREWHEKFKPEWSDSHAKVTLSRLERDVFPWIGGRPVAEINAPEVLTVLQRMEARGAAETARRMRIVCGQVFRYAVATGRADRNPVPDLKGALAKPKSKHMAAFTEPKDVGPLLRAIDSYKGSFVVQCALKMAALTFVRPGELRKAEWNEIDFETAQWNIPAEKMKMEQAHVVPLSSQAVAILKELQPLTGFSAYLFPSHRSPLRPMSDNAVLSALRRMGFEKEEMSGHGFRAMARTILDEVLGVRPDFIEHQLAHKVRDPNGRAYNRTAHLSERRRMMQQWGDYLDGLKKGAKVIPFKKVAGE